MTKILIPKGILRHPLYVGYSIGRVCLRCIIKTKCSPAAAEGVDSDDCILLNGI
jgi:hypothetical protein